MLVISVSLRNVDKFRIYQEVHSQAPGVTLVKIATFSPRHCCTSTLSGKTGYLVPGIRVESVYQTSCQLTGKRRPNARCRSSRATRRTCSGLSPRSTNRCRGGLAEERARIVDLYTHKCASRRVNSCLNVNRSAIGACVGHIARGVSIGGQARTIVY